MLMKWVESSLVVVLGVGVTADDFKWAVISILATSSTICHLLIISVSLSLRLSSKHKHSRVFVCAYIHGFFLSYWSDVKKNTLECKSVDVSHRITWEKNSDVSCSIRRVGLALGMPTCCLPLWGTWECTVFGKEWKQDRERQVGCYTEWMKSVGSQMRMSPNGEKMCWDTNIIPQRSC